MKCFIALFFALNPFLGFTDLVASQTEDHLTYFWTGDEEDLYLNIDLVNGLEFADTYTTIKISDGEGQGCELVCKPIIEDAILTSEGQALQEIKFTVVLNNGANPKKVSSTIIQQNVYKSVNQQGLLVSTTSESKEASSLNNPAIDLTQAPVFFKISDESSPKGVICFKNSFPYSEMN